MRCCRLCGCTDDRACPGGCWWVEVDLCSQCELPELLAELAGNEIVGVLPVGVCM